MDRIVCWNCKSDLLDYAKKSGSLKYCPNCGKLLDHGKVLKMEGYGDRGQGHLYAPNFSSSELPYQGWKVHVSANPEEAYILSEQLLPKLIEADINHKVIKDRSLLKKYIGSEHKNRYKFIVIYPGMSSEAEKLLKQFPKKGSVQVFFRNPSNQVFSFKKRKMSEIRLNNININSNRESTSKILAFLEEKLRKSSVKIAGGPKITADQADENAVFVEGQKTRVKYRYDIVSGAGVVAKDAKILDKNFGWLKKNSGSWKDLSPTDKVIGVKGDSIKEYRESKDVRKFKGFKSPV